MAKNYKKDNAQFSCFQKSERHPQSTTSSGHAKRRVEACNSSIDSNCKPSFFGSAGKPVLQCALDSAEGPNTPKSLQPEEQLIIFVSLQQNCHQAATMKYFTPSEVSYHSSVDDLWVSFLDKVYNLTPLMTEDIGSTFTRPLLLVAGNDISHWFDSQTRTMKKYIDPVTNCETIYAPYGPFLHCPPFLPRSDWANDFSVPWWEDETYYIGRLSTKTRLIRILNSFTSQAHVVEVCSEEKIDQILERYVKYNSHALSYTWKYMGKPLDMSKTLAENGIEDEEEVFKDLRMNPNEFLPTIQLYYNDDLTEA